MKKLGRPLIGELKSKDIKVRVDETTYNKLLKYCQQSGATKAGAIREALKNFLKYNT